jgi:hypothetical protein
MTRASRACTPTAVRTGGTGGSSKAGCSRTLTGGGAELRSRQRRRESRISLRFSIIESNMPLVPRRPDWLSKLARTSLASRPTKPPSWNRSLAV